MEKQKNVFLKGEGDEWYRRNEQAIDNNKEHDPVIKLLDLYQIAPKSVLEVGCSNGWRLDAIQQKNNSICFGIDPSQEAIQAGKKRFSALQLTQGAADKLEFENNAFDLIILGFCLYLCDRDDLFKIASEVDRVLADNGVIAIYDFYSTIPYFNRYQYQDGIHSYKLCYENMFCWNPNYRKICSMNFSHDKKMSLNINKDDEVNVSLLKKEKSSGYIANPYK